MRSVKSSSVAAGRTGKHGLIPLNSPQTFSNDAHDGETYPVDIVAIHGIAGDALGTWTHENGKLWLRDFLPNDLPGARVFSFGYPAEISLSRSTGNLDTFCRSLLESLKRERRSREVRLDSSQNLNVEVLNGMRMLRRVYSIEGARSYLFVIVWAEL